MDQSQGWCDEGLICPSIRNVFLPWSHHHTKHAQRRIEIVQGLSQNGIASSLKHSFQESIQWWQSSTPPFGIDIYTHTYALNVYWSWLQVALTLLQGWHIEVQLLLDSNPHRQRPFDFWRCLKANTVGEFIWKATKRVRRSGSIFPLDCKVSFLPPREKRRAVLAWLAGMKQFVSAGQTGRLRSLAFGMTPESLSAWLPERIEDRLQMSGSPNCLAFM